MQKGNWVIHLKTAEKNNDLHKRILLYYLTGIFFKTKIVLTMLIFA